MKGAPRSAHFDDIYFSARDGMAETAHVFLAGNNLPHAWEGCENFTIFETGFGTGLNFLCAWKLFCDTATAGQHLHFISVERYPLTPQEITNALAHWREELGVFIDEFLPHYPLRIGGMHRIQINPQVTLTLIFDDINHALPQIEGAVDCWFLDGFTPAKNPQMWTQVLYDTMALLSVAGARFASFTAASAVRHGLEAAGFHVQKQKGFAYKKDMITGVFAPQKSTATLRPQALGRDAKIAIIGAGLAGTSLAYALKHYGYAPTIYEASGDIASGASGNAVGLYNPRFTAQRDAVSEFFAPAYAALIRLAHQAGAAVGFDPCGALHLINTPEKQARFEKMQQSWGWYPEHLQILDAAQASAVAGIELEQSALYLPQSGAISPKALCHYYARDIDVVLNTRIDDLAAIDADVVFICNAAAAREFKPLSWLPLETVRGQVSHVKATPASQNLKCNLHYGGYFARAREGEHTIGATFQKWIAHTDVLEEDNTANLETLAQNVPALGQEGFKVHQARAGMRTASQDRFPLVGVVPDHKNMYISLAFGSHGIVGAWAAAQHLAGLIAGLSPAFPRDTLYALSPQRFLDRAKKRKHQSHS